MKKNKVLKWVGGFVLLLLLLLVATPFLFKGKVQNLVVETINKNLNANVAFDEVDLSLFKSFPKATIVIKNLSIVNKAPFEGDTLFKASDIGLRMSVMELFKGKNTPMHIEGIGVSDAFVNIVVNKEGITNYDIAIVDEEESSEKDDNAPFSLSLNKYVLENIAVSYVDEASKMAFTIKDLYHNGSGNLAANVLDLDTETKAILSFEKDGTRFLNEVKLGLKAVIGMDLNTNTYVFKDNEALINQLPLRFDGSLKLLEDGQAYDLSFGTPDSSFKNFLGLVPEVYAGNISNVKTTGDFRVEGRVKGLLTDTTIPKLDIQLASSNASFQYPDLPKSVEKIILDAKIINETGLMNDTYVLLNKLSFQIDQDVFNASANIRNLSGNALVDAKLNGVINLANVTKAYPVKLEKPLTGILKANVATRFDMESVEKNQYQNIQNSGTISLTGFQFESDEMAKPLQIEEAALTFNPSQVKLNSLRLKTGTTDVSATGTLDNFYGFMFSKQNLKGNFDVRSNNFVVSDVLKADDKAAKTSESSEEAVSKSVSEPLKIPAFLDCTIQANAKQVVYDDLKLQNVVGTLIIKDQKALLKNMSTDVFDGKIAFDGSISTKQTVPDFDMTLGMKALDIGKAFTGLDVLKAIAPIAGVLNGKINSTVTLQGKLDSKTMSPVMSSLTGDLLGQLLNTTIKPENSKLLSTLTDKVDFIDLEKLNLNNLKAHLIFKEGKVQVQPFDLKYQDVAVVVQGEHGFDQSINYNLDFNVPVKYLGDDVEGLLAKLSPSDINKLDAIPVKVGLLGSFSKPQVTTDLSKVVQGVTNQILEQQKRQLLDKGKDALEDLLAGKKKEVKSDGENIPEEPKGVKEEVKNKVEQGLKDLFGKKK
ncbi:AsmA-like C-terminal region-containing protein [Myroides guanonis]|uniref:AsmA-like C-terminal region n=1 Tax=Myroides guanonis TaxID=1150112 RepID=A0A1I3NS63_9FLAO|nr:AsmA-like C-terminal region-containing protein [Myroides guanonis]SFJ11820.1 AsmA-like C-terminal region [Myroides guanonis]